LHLGPDLIMMAFQKSYFPAASRITPMKNILLVTLPLSLIAAFAIDAAAHLATASGTAKANAPLAHMVFFGLKDRSPESRQKFLDSCVKYLQNHEGTIYFSVGKIAEDKDVQEPVSVHDFDVALHVVFDSKESKAKYLVNPRHTQFVEENRPFFANVRVFDSFLETPATAAK
jgi:hypothetical protein